MSDLRPHVLCIDDDRETAGLVAEELVDRGFRVSLAFDGEQGFQAILNTQPDLALVDVTMPVLSGFDLRRRLLAMAPRFDSMPFLYLTALSDRTNELKGRQLGADDYITKPIDFDILTAIITTRLHRVARAAADPRDFDLTDRELEALTWAARGKTSSEIATILNLTKRTVDFHIDNARLKLNASTRMHAAVKAAAGGLIRL
ncbi:MAG TPA: response regulator [Rhodopila sp.]|jgi:DNA-binding response OmpR family regulator|nr:response regulator [Rhodopila sp.]